MLGEAFIESRIIDCRRVEVGTVPVGWGEIQTSGEREHTVSQAAARVGSDLRNCHVATVGSRRGFHNMLDAISQ
jgi:hypothetical protein